MVTPSLETVIEQLNRLANEHFCGEVKIAFHGGVPVEITRAEAQKLTIGAHRRPGLETRTGLR